LVARRGAAGERLTIYEGLGGMNGFMPSGPSPFAFAGTAALELVLRDRDGAPWVLRLSPDAAKFIGAYARIDGFGAGGPLLVFQAAGQTA
jgi:hypothetical protein